MNAPRVLLLDGRPRPPADEMAEHAESLTTARAGTIVDAIAYGPLERHPERVQHLVVLDSAAPLQAPRSSAPARVLRMARRVLTGSGAATRFARLARGGQAADLLAEADLIIALDSTSIRTAWLASQRRNGEVSVVYGIAAGLSELANLA